ncbi:MAG TPA: hypothetical protein VHF25_11335, partial [Nitriliruptorales bacterium]|nr:hypothetical protein [Nitriliruptorales bacterium]
MSVDAIVTLAVLAVVVVALARELVSPVTGIMGALVVLLLAGVVDAQRAFAGFSNPATITVAALLVVARAVQDTGGIDMLLGRVLDQHGSD